jgi:hypothetical protein
VLMGLGLKPQKSVKQVQEALFQLLEAHKRRAPDATVAPFRTVSLGSSVNKTGDCSNGEPSGNR